LESDDLKPNLKSDKQIAINLRLGIVLPKRRVKHSVCRNLIKRWVKELLKSSEMCADIVIRVNCPVSIKTKQEKNIIFNELKTLLASVSAEYEKII
jgi:ribonuclease P protein component